MVQQPLERVVQSLPGILLLMFVAQLFWVIGIHGNQMIKPIREPLLLGAITVNMSAFEQGKEVPNIITMPFWDVYMSIGGSGLTIGLLIAVMIATKRKEMKEIAKLSIGPGIFNINEPVIFGMPIMLNPILAIPFIITPLVTGSIGYFATVTGFAGKAVVMVPDHAAADQRLAVNRGLHGGGDHPVYLHRDRGDYLSAVCENCLTPRRAGRAATSHR